MQRVTAILVMDKAEVTDTLFYGAVHIRHTVISAVISL
jgi:hypothetical protein